MTNPSLHFLGLDALCKDLDVADGERARASAHTLQREEPPAHGRRGREINLGARVKRAGVLTELRVAGRRRRVPQTSLDGREVAADAVLARVNPDLGHAPRLAQVSQPPRTQLDGAGEAVRHIRAEEAIDGLLRLRPRRLARG